MLSHIRIICYQPLIRSPFYTSRITQSFTGSEREEYLKKLDSIINNHVDSYAKQFSRMTGSFLSEHGVNEEAEMISASIKDL